MMMMKNHFSLFSYLVFAYHNFSSMGIEYRGHNNNNNNNNNMSACLCRVLYWTDWSPTSPGIYRSSVDNPAREAVVTGNLYYPYAFAINFTGRVISQVRILAYSDHVILTPQHA